MAKMFPDYPFEKINTMIQGDGANGERCLYKFMKENLPQEWSVLYNTHIFCGNDIQSDFLVFVPNKGIVNVDAKGNGYFWQNNRMYLNSEQNPVDIFYKADRAISTLNGYIRTNLSNNRSWGAFGKLIAFPLNDFERRDRIDIPGDYHYLLAGQMQNDPEALKKAIEQELEYHNAEFSNFTMWGKKILEHFLARRDSIARTWEFIDAEKKLEPVLTAKQRDIFVAIQKNKEVHVRGGAGTGKTLLAMAAAEYFGGAGQRVLMVCFNKILAEVLRAKRLKNVTVSHFHGIAQALSNVNLTQIRDGQFDRESSDKSIHDFLDKYKREKYDLILIDEAQDLTEENIIALTYLRKHGGKLAIFSDLNQAIFEHSWNSLTSLFLGIREEFLNTNMRNTDLIHKEIVKISKEDTLPGGLVHGVPVSHFSKPVPELIQSLFEEGIQPGDIAVLSPLTDALTELRQNRGNIKSTEAIAIWKNSRQNAVLFSTIHAFKGLEANCVIILASKQCQNDEIRYVGESRAKYRLYLQNQ